MLLLLLPLPVPAAAAAGPGCCRCRCHPCRVHLAPTLHANLPLLFPACSRPACRWDEDVFGLEYDLDLFNIVAVDDFNMGGCPQTGNVAWCSAVLGSAARWSSDEAVQSSRSIHPAHLPSSPACPSCPPPWPSRPLEPLTCLPAGAMENKSLNVFNSWLVRATPDTATDGDFARIEGG